MKIAENVYAVLDLAHPIGVNAGFVVTEEGVVVVDSGWTHASALTILGYIDAVAPHGDVRYLIWTEHHADHIFGGHPFKERGAEVIAHRLVSEFLQDEGRSYVSQQRGARNDVWRNSTIVPEGCDFGATFFRDVELVLPDRTIDEETMLRVGREEIRLIPTPGHLRDSICVYLPRAKVLFAGDTVYSGYPPTTRFGDQELWRLWVSSLERLCELEIRTIIPGHGAPCGRDELERNAGFLRKLLDYKAAS